MTRQLLCTKCGGPVDVVEDVTGLVDWGRAVVDDDGTVRPAAQRMDFYRGDAVRARAVCPHPDCRHQWTLRRRFEPTTPEETR